MNDTFETFPANRTEALTMLLLQNRDLSETSPEELADLYLEIKGRIAARFVEKSKK